MPRPSRRAPRVLARRVGEHDLRERDAAQHCVERGAGADEPGQIDVVSERQIVFGIDRLFDHQPAQRRAVRAVVVPPLLFRLLERETYALDQVAQDAGADFLHQARPARI